VNQAELQRMGSWATVSAWLAAGRLLRRQRRRRLLRACCPHSAVPVREQVRAVERILTEFGVQP
jgi:hypothetical protein